MTMPPESAPSVTALANAVMQGVARAGVVNDENMQRAVEIMREEVKAMLFEDRYADARDCVMQGSVSDGYILALVITECVAKLRDEGARPPPPPRDPVREWIAKARYSSQGYYEQPLSD